MKKIFIAGGGSIGLNVAKLLEDTHNIRIVELNEARAISLAEELNNTLVLQGSASDEDLLKEEGLQPWRVKEVWVMSTQNPDHFIDITTTFDKKMKALHSHVSQTAHNENLETMVREWGERNALANNLPAGSVAEVFKIVNTN